MNYLIYGNEQYLIDKEIEKIISENSSSTLLRYDGQSKDFNIDDLLSNCETDSLFGDKTLILYKNPSFLINKTDDNSFNKIKSYLEIPNSNCILLIYSSYSSFNSKLKSFKDLNSLCETKFLKNLDDKRFFEYCDNVISTSNLVISRPIRNRFIENCGNDLDIFHSCFKVLELYDGEITQDVLEQLTYSSGEFNVFILVNSIIDCNISKSMHYVKKIENDDKSIFGLMSLVSGQLRYLYSVYYYSDIYDKEKDVLEATNTSNPYKLQMAYKTLNKISPKKILSLLNKLSILDYEFKTNSSLDHKLQFEMFISSLKA